MRIGLLPTLFVLATPGLAQQHTHGEAQAFIAEQDGVWQVSLNISVYDALGFEHKPESAEEKQALTTFIALSQKNESMLTLEGRCSLKTQSLTLPDHITLGPDSNQHEGAHYDDHHHDDHDEHEHDDDHHHDDHDEHEHDDDHHHDDHDEHEHDDDHHHGDHDEHSDIELSITYQCEQTPDALHFHALSTLPALQKLEVQWFTSAGQGAKTLTSGNAKLTW